ncbi:MAG: hypothetical protein JO252_24305, partial [Planctomycetaceae bacterium]|nr:hypothetical protein [Planctomycetaceae bacterium]MBV8553946.1 hypothetical protein [Planctomycetaceae bacterium]
DPLEIEPEDWVGLEKRSPATVSVPYTIERRPVPTQGAREVMLPPGVYIDMTTWDTTAERSRLPIEGTAPYLTVDVMLNPSGQVVPTRTYSSPAAFGLRAAFYHFWISEQQDLHMPHEQPGVAYSLPMLAGASTAAVAANPTAGNGFPAPGDTFWKNTPLRGEHRLLTLYTRTGNLVVNEVVAAEPNPSAPTGSLPYWPGFLGTAPPGYSSTVVPNNPFIGAEIGLKQTP